jgi:hypothetical protein
MSHRPLIHTLTALALLAFAAPASAHIRLLEPTPRYAIQGTETGIKSCPCGSGGSNRTCNVTVDGSDPDRSTDRVSTFEAGSTITLRFEEFVDHVGSFRVAFDSDGADFGDFNGNILVPLVADPAGANGTMWEIDVTLPNMTCTNCTLQLIQAMNGDMVNPVIDPANVSSYYACVDLELVAPGTLGEGDDTAEPGDEPGTGGIGGNGADTSGGGMGTGGAATTTNVGALQPTAGAPGNPTLGSGGGSATASAGGNGPNTAANMQSPPGLPLGNLPQSDSGASSEGCSLMGAPRSGQLAALVGAGLLSAFALRRRVRRERR